MPPCPGEGKAGVAESNPPPFRRRPACGSLPSLSITMLDRSMPSGGKKSRDERLAEALRANLRRRKQQDRARAENEAERGLSDPAKQPKSRQPEDRQPQDRPRDDALDRNGGTR